MYYCIVLHSTRTQFLGILFTFTLSYQSSPIGSCHFHFPSIGFLPVHCFLIYVRWGISSNTLTASLNSFSFITDTKMESWVLVNSPYGCQFMANQVRKPLSLSGYTDSRTGLVKFMKCNSDKGDGISSICSLRSLRSKLVRAKSNESGDGENVHETDIAIQASGEKRKKVVSVRKEIAGRRKSVSPPDHELSPEDSDGPSPEINAGISHDSIADESPDIAGSIRNIKAVTSTNDQNPVFPASLGKERREQMKAASATPSLDFCAQKEMTKVQENASSRLDKRLVGDKKGTKETVSHEKNASVIDSVKKPVKTSDLPDFSLETSKPSVLKDDNDQELKESTSQEKSKQVIDPAGQGVKRPPLAGANVMNVILVAVECAPWCKTGGLGDVAGALPKALARRGHRVMVVTPRYGNFADAQDIGIRKRYRVDGQDIEACYYHAYIDGVDFVFIDIPPFRHIENNIYGGNRMDILKRMVLFCKAAVEVPWYVPCRGTCYGDGNLVFIANDWHTALLPVYLKAYYRDNGVMKYTRSILVVHNIAHQGRGPVDDFSYVDLPPHYLDYFKIYDPVGGEHFNIFAAGLKAADRIVTVSHGYSWELKTQEGGWGLHGIINENDWKLRGVVNGIDTNEWNPQFDVHLKCDDYTNYTIETLKPGKMQCKAALQKELNLPVREDVPLIGFIGRLDPQKGVDLIAEAVPWLMGQDVQLVMLGTGRYDLEEMLRQFEAQHRDKIRGWVGFSVKLSHRITAGADILLMPSRFEPCGLNQLYAMNYGTVPVVHAVGGLRDTVQPFDPFNETGLGWTFDRAETNHLINALGNCLLTYRKYKRSWQGIQRRGMSQDLSWDHAAENYEEVLVAAKYQW